MERSKERASKATECLFSEEHVQLIKDNYQDWFNNSFATRIARPRASISPIPGSLSN